MIVLAQEGLLSVMDDVEPLLKEHYQELTLHKDRIKLAPDWATYMSMEEQGGLVIFTARDQGALAGYSAFFVYWHPHYRETRVAQNDVLFLRKDYRKGSTGIRLIRYSEDRLRHLGVDKLVWHVKQSNNFTPILQRMGYGVEDIMVGKIL